MSLYTPVFPPFRDSSASRKGPPENNPAPAPGKRQNYVEFLRDVHLFLATQNDVLSPPSRPNSPLFDCRVQGVRDKVRDVLSATEGGTSSGKWACVNQTLKLGCVRGRYRSECGTTPCTPEEDTDWILPDEESEWIEWEKKREENRRLRAKTNVSQQTDVATCTVLGSQKTNPVSSAESARRPTRQRFPQDVTPTTLRIAKEKVRKWQSSITSEAWHDTESGSSLASTSAVVAGTVVKGNPEGQKRTRTLDFAVVKPTAKLTIGKGGKSHLSLPGVRGSIAPTPSQKSISSLPSKAADAPKVKVPVGADEIGSSQPPKVSPVTDDAPKIANIPETPYLPPSFPSDLKTSTPLSKSAMIVRAKPSPILPIPALSSTPLPSASAGPPGERQLASAEPHAASVPSCLTPQPPQIDTVQPGKRSRAPSTPLDGVVNDPPVTPPAKKLRTLSQNRCTASGAPSTPGQNDRSGTGVGGAQGFPEKIPSPSKSVRSHFSAPDSDPGDSPMKANLLLESPVSPMLSYAQNPSSFLPQITSTQVGEGSPRAGRTNGGGAGMGYSSQFDVERHVDRVSELLEKEVDFDGWLRDVRAVETSQD